VVSSANRHGREPLCRLGALPFREERFPLLRSALPNPPRSYGLMRQTSPLWPVLPSLLVPVCAGCDESLLRRGPSRRYLCVSVPRCLDPSPGGVLGAPPHCVPNTIGLPPVPMGRRTAKLRSATSERGGLRSCSHALMFRPRGLLPPRSLPPPCLYTGQPWRLRPSRTPVVTFLGIGYARRPNG
jgi:hypothetical protein